MAAAYFTGFHDDQPEAVASDASAIWDIVPGEPHAANGGPALPQTGGKVCGAAPVTSPPPLCVAC
jgi:hypothetical protein